jgi:hypothetical protein
MKKRNETWNQYLRNKNVRPKTFNLTVTRNERGSFEVVGNNSLMLDNMGSKHRWVRVNTRDITNAIRENGLVCK